MNARLQANTLRPRNWITSPAMARALIEATTASAGARRKHRKHYHGIALTIAIALSALALGVFAAIH